MFTLVLLALVVGLVIALRSAYQKNQELRVESQAIINDLDAQIEALKAQLTDEEKAKAERLIYAFRAGVSAQQRGLLFEVRRNVIFMYYIANGFRANAYIWNVLRDEKPREAKRITPSAAPQAAPADDYAPPPEYPEEVGV